MSNDLFNPNHAERIHVAAHTTLFQEGDSAEYAYRCIAGKCILSQNAEPLGTAPPDTILDSLAVLGSLPHQQRAITQTDCKFLRWEMATLWQDAEFSATARAYLARELQASSQRLQALEAPIKYQGYSAQLNTGPFIFNNSTILFAFAEAKHLPLTLPDGIARVGKRIIIGLAEFRDAYYEHDADTRFSYTETTFFVPVRVGTKLGLFVPYIYPSTYEPILLGREIYGFPKRLGMTTFSDKQSSLAIAGETLFTVTWGQQQTVDEPRIVGAMGGSFGVPNPLTSAAFRVGDTALNMLGVPFYRRIGVFNHKQILSATTTHDKPRYDVDMLTQALFSVNRWHSIDYLPDAKLSVTGLMLRDWGLQIREAYLTRLDMRLSTGRIVRDYRANS